MGLKKWLKGFGGSVDLPDKKDVDDVAEVVKRHEVYLAEPYRPSDLGSFGKASCMLLRQYQFPHFYTDQDKHLSADHDRCLMWDRDHTSRCFDKYVSGRTNNGFEGWARTAREEDIMAFLKDVLKADPSVVWTGFRLLGTVNRSNGYPVWSFELFAKHPESDIEVYTGDYMSNGDYPPNVKQPQGFRRSSSYSGNYW